MADIADVYQTIEANGGSGEFETAEVDETQRWVFPRFPGAEKLGTCSDKNGDAPEGHEGVHTKRKGCGKNFEPDMGNMYLSRAGIGGYDSDVETLEGWLNAPRNIIGMIALLGEPGSGKTALIEAAVTRAERELTTVVCTPDHTKDSLFLRFVGEGKGDPIDPKDPDSPRSPYTLGPIPYAAKHGHTLYCDEAYLLLDGVKPVLYPLADGRRFLPEGNVDGSALEIHPDFRLIISSNPLVRGASLPEPLGSRCASTTLTVETDEGLLRELGVDEAVISAWSALKALGLWTPQVRELRLADYWLQASPEQSVSAFVPEHCPPGEREKITGLVRGYFGGDIRADGRLVVK